MKSRVLHEPSLRGVNADIVVVGGGAAGFGVVASLEKNTREKLRILLLEQNNHFGGSGSASLQHFRTYQGHKALSVAVEETVDWYKILQSERRKKNHEIAVTRFPYIFIAQTTDQLDKYKNSLEKVNRWGFGRDAQVVDAPTFYKRYPFFNIQGKESIAGALIYPDAGRLNFRLALESITAKATKTIFCLGTKMDKIIVKGGKVIAVRTQRGTIYTEKVVLSLGPSIFNLNSYTDQNGQLAKVNFQKTICIQKRQSFSSIIKRMPKDTKFFLIAPNGAYVRVEVKDKNRGEGRYGYADPDDPCLIKPAVHPRAQITDFSKKVYKQLEQFISNEASIPKDGKAGYYVQTPDDFPIVSATHVKGLFVFGALSHLGIMTHIGLGNLMAKIMLGDKAIENPFDINRDFHKGKGIVL